MALDRGGQIERGGVLRYVNRLDRTGRRGAGQDDREDRQPSGGADEAQVTISNCKSPAYKSPAGDSPARFTRTAHRRRRAPSLCYQITAIQASAIQHYVYFTARGRCRAAGAHQRKEPMNACSAHRVSTILPI